MGLGAGLSGTPSAAPETTLDTGRGARLEQNLKSWKLLGGKASCLMPRLGLETALPSLSCGVQWLACRKSLPVRSPVNPAEIALMGACFLSTLVLRGDVPLQPQQLPIASSLSCGRRALSGSLVSGKSRRPVLLT